LDITRFKGLKDPSIERPYSQRLIKSVKVAVLGDREIFGEEEIVTLDKRKYTVTCISTDFQVYTIEKEV
jgi:hypothetical protein